MSKKRKIIKIPINTAVQTYKGIRLMCIDRDDYHVKFAKRFTINGTNQNVWIPNKHLAPDGTLKQGENIDYVFMKSRRQCEIAGVNLREVWSWDIQNGDKDIWE
ncbi:hypothetical protein SELR_17960 [Selenomonas ruminantium subsp. lactilytica TAM6421]|uniref:Uncharacterized protein n=1 Tax=Selenomonas ruminantium subsp. lactilytica (strain NBRC 103574 / TAM6421) TaxID=927704 RepID=I0GRW7_SELRL|nr:hypothetical protein [Selenomonas ruminantium]BAL83504.1 hypothetical protein SELR_17960 [Selenomonas ruminantium subsp. lactilytica TAM6421]